MARPGPDRDGRRPRRQRLRCAAEAPGGSLWLLLPVAAFAVGVVAVPELRWSRWRYEVRDEEIDLRHGTVTITRTLIPMLRVQHVDTTRGPLDQLLGLATVVVHTAAGRTTIPGARRRVRRAAARPDRDARADRR